MARYKNRLHIIVKKPAQWKLLHDMDMSKFGFTASAADISLMVSASAVAATVTTVFMGALSDKIGKRKLFICLGYIMWGISIFSFILLREDIDHIATNPDWVCPTWYGSVPDCGAIAQILCTATGKSPKFIGKPEPDMAHLAIAKSGFKSEEAVLIGDRLYTDIACGVNAGISTIFVLSGEGTMEDVEKSDKKPEFIYDNIRKVYDALVK